MAPNHGKERLESATAVRRVAVARAEAHFRACIDAPLPISSLCRVVGLSERGLREAFYSVRGIGPKQWMLAERLQGVRRVLSDGCSDGATVTRVASDFGFFQLGRFAATYRKAFGEAPSATLRGARIHAQTPQVAQSR